MLDAVTRPALVNTSAPAADSLQSYVVQRIPLNSVELKIGKNEDYINTDLSRIRVYSFTYFDNVSFLENAKISPLATPDTEELLIQSGMGFVNKIVCRGTRYSFEQQTPNNVVVADIVAEEKTDPDIRKVSDSRTYQALDVTDVKREMNRNTNSLIRTASNKNKIGKVIKNENFFSDLWVTRCEDDNARYGFVFDKLAYLVENSQLPFLYQNSNTATELLMGGGDLDLSQNETARCLNVTMTRRQMRKENSLAVNDLTFGRQKKFQESYYRPEKVVPTPQEVPSLSTTFNQVGSKRLVFYEGYDTYEDDFKTLTSGIYQYAAEFVVYDPSVNYIRKVVDRLQSIYSRTVDMFDLIINSPPAKVGISDDNAEDGSGLYDARRNECPYRPYLLVLVQRLRL